MTARQRSVRVAPREARDLVDALAEARACGFAPGTLEIDERIFSQVLAIDAPARTARVQPGCGIEALRHEAASYGLTFAPSGTGNARTIGEFVASPLGSSPDQIVALDVLTNDGARLHAAATAEDELNERASGDDRVAAIYREIRELRKQYRDRIRDEFVPLGARLTGNDLGMLLDERDCNIALALAGGERRLVTLLEVTCRLAQHSAAVASATFGFSSLAAAMENAPFAVSYGALRVAVLDAASGASEPGLPHGAAWLCASFGGESDLDASEAAESLCEAFRRRDGAPSIAMPSFTYGESLPSDESDRLVLSVPVELVGPFVREFEEFARAEQQAHGLCGDALHGLLWTSESAAGLPLAYLLGVATIVRRYHGTLRWPKSEAHEYELRRALYGKDLTQALADFERIWLPTGARAPRVLPTGEDAASVGVGEIAAGAGVGVALGAGKTLIRRLFPGGTR